MLWFAAGPLIAVGGSLASFSLGVDATWFHLVALLAMLLVVGATLYDYRCTPDESGLRLIRDLPTVVGLESLFVREVTVAFTPAPSAAPRFPGRAELELHEAAPAAFEALEPWTAEEESDPDWEPRGLAPLDFARGVRVKLRAPEGLAPDAAPSLAKVAWTAAEGQLPASVSVVFRQSYRARRRGRFALGALALFVVGPLGLARRRLFFDGHQSLRVEPAMAGLTRTLQLVASQRWWDLGVARALRQRGGRTEFESLRDYVPGDEPRTIDWKAFARRGKPMVRQFEPERGQEVVLLFDCGRRMGASVVEPGLPEWSKLDHALDAGLEFAAAVLSQGDRVGLVAYDSRILSFVAPARARRQLLRLKEAVFDLAPSDRESDLAAALDELNARHRRRSLVIVLSDLTDPLGVEAEALALAHAGRHRLVFCAFSDRDLVALAEEPPRPGFELEAAAARRLASERQVGLTQMAQRARVLDLEAARTAGPLLSAWFQERRQL